MEARLEPGRIRRPADLARFLHGWQGGWRTVLSAASAPEACADARAELREPAEQAIAWLRRDIVDLCDSVLGVAPYLEGPGAPHTAGDRSALDGLLSSPASAWGVAYVLRGSRLGGSVLAPALRLRLNLASGFGTTFLASEGTDPGREWVAFQRRLDALELGQVGLRAAVDAARWAFSWVGTVVAAGLTHRPLDRQDGLVQVTSGLSS